MLCCPNVEAVSTITKFSQCEGVGDHVILPSAVTVSPQGTTCVSLPDLASDRPNTSSRCRAVRRGAESAEEDLRSDRYRGILIHWYAGWSQHELATSLGVDRKTLRKYTGPAVAAGISPGGPPMVDGDWRELVVEGFPHLADTRPLTARDLVIDVRRDALQEMRGVRIRMPQAGRGQARPLAAGKAKSAISDLCLVALAQLSGWDLPGVARWMLRSRPQAQLLRSSRPLSQWL